MTRAERAAEATALRAQGLLLREIVERMGISKSYLCELLSDPGGHKVARRRLSYQGTCEVCGGPTHGYEGKAKAPTVCATCFRRRQHDERYWTQERVIASIRDWAAEHGRTPTAAEWGIVKPPPPGFPWYAVVVHELGTWANAIEAAGFERRPTGVQTPEGRARIGASVRARPLKTHCKHGHPFDERNTLTWRGKRRCRECHNRRVRERYARRKREAAAA